MTGDSASDIVDRLTDGHAYQEHIDEFKDLGVTTPQEYRELMEEVLNDPSVECFTGYSTKDTSREADFYYNEDKNILIVDPRNEMHEPTAYRPTDGREQFESKLDDSMDTERRPIHISHGMEELYDKRAQIDAEYFANSVDDPEKYPPKDEAMAELVEDRRASEEIASNLRVAEGGDAELSAEDKEAQMQDRMEAYLSAQKDFSMGMG